VLKFGDVYESGEELPESLNEEEGIPMALNEMRQAYASSEVRELIEARRKAAHDEATRLARARRQGEEAGEAKGRAESKQEIARRMLAAGMSREVVIELTGLTANDL